MIHSYRTKIGNFLSTKTGKGLNIVISTVSDLLLPGSGTGLGIVDNFLLDDVLPKNNAISFLNNKLPSIFRKD